MRQSISDPIEVATDFLHLQHPFLIELLWSHKDEDFLYMMFPYQAGGELFSYLRTTGRFSINTAHFYAVEIVSALEYLHSLSIVYRDLKVGNATPHPGR